MKKNATKTTETKKLMLDKSSVRALQSQLTDDQLQIVAGGRGGLTNIAGTCI